MRLSTKVLIWAWLILLSVIGGVVYSAYSKLSPDSLITLLNQQVQKNYPGSQLTIARVDYGFSVDFKLSLKTLTLIRGGKTLASANELELKVPWWLILLNRGNAQLNISDLTVFVSTDIDSDAETKKSPEGPASTQTSPANFELPKYLIDARYTLRAKNISIKELDGDRRLFTLSKLLVRELQLEKNSAFELNIPITITYKGKSFSSNLWLFGDVTPRLENLTVSYRGEFKTRESMEGLELDDLIINGKSDFSLTKFNLTSLVDLSIDRQKLGSGEISAKDNEIQINLKFTKFPLEYLSAFGEEIKNPFFKNLKGEAQGEVLFRSNWSHDSTANLSAKLHFPGQFSFDETHHLDGKWFLGFENEKWETSFVSPKGEVNFHRRAVLDYATGVVSQYSQEIGFNAVDMDQALRAVDAFSTVLTPVSNNYFSSFISFKNCLDKDKQTNGFFRVGRSPYETFYQGEILQDNSKMVLNYLAKNNTQKISIEFNEFSWNPTYLFMDPIFSASQGVITGKVNGSWITHWTDGKWLFKLKTDQLKDEKGEFARLNQQLWDFFTVDYLAVSTKSWDITVYGSLVKLNSLVLDGADPAIISGHLTTLSKGKSYVMLSHPKNKSWKPVRKDVTEIFWKKDTP